ncbi:MAG: glycosyl hydrolase family 8 [Chromatiales bacterium]|nr:glycosyl hydrolase family 8 [Chromatiales bacterium]
MVKAVWMLSLLACLAGCQTWPGRIEAEQWQNYRQNFITPEGRVIDNANGGVSHSEGQGYGMLLAVSADDGETFQRLWHWTQTHLAIREDGLFAWRWDPSVEGGISDRNSATDGDLLIAWALSRAARHFGNDRYRQHASEIIRSLRHTVARETPMGSVLLPGAFGFEVENGVILNPSYFIFPAYAELATLDDAPYWIGLARQNAALLENLQRYYTGFIPDWTLLGDRGWQAPPGLPHRFGYDALRVPLYLCWGGERVATSMAEIEAYWKGSDARAWIALDGTEERASYPPGDAHRAVQRLLQSCLGARSEFQSIISPLPEDYYAATLTLLAQIAWQERFRQ